jgi:type II secretory pathway pseudopilin PulG
MLMPWSSLAPVAGSLVSGIFGKKAAKKSSAATAAANQANRDMQYDFAKNSIQWKTEDARKAGLHPLAALGAQGYSPTIGQMADTSEAQALSQAGANIGNAISNYRRPDPMQKKLQQAQLMRQIAETESALAQAALDKNRAARDTVLMAAQASAVTRNNQQKIHTHDQEFQGERISAPATVHQLSPLSDWKTSVTPPAERMGDEYGDLAESIYGGVRWINDLFINLGLTPSGVNRMLDTTPKKGNTKRFYNKDFGW